MRRKKRLRAAPFPYALRLLMTERNMCLVTLRFPRKKYTFGSRWGQMRRKGAEEVCWQVKGDYLTLQLRGGYMEDSRSALVESLIIWVSSRNRFIIIICIFRRLALDMSLVSDFRVRRRKRRSERIARRKISSHERVPAGAASVITAKYAGGCWGVEMSSRPSARAVLCNLTPSQHKGSYVLHF